LHRGKVITGNPSASQDPRSLQAPKAARAKIAPAIPATHPEGKTLTALTAEKNYFA